MGAGRRTSTYDIDTGAQQLGFVERQRNLGENLGGVIFGMRVLQNDTANTYTSSGNCIHLLFSLQAVVTKRMMSA